MRLLAQRLLMPLLLTLSLLTLLLPTPAAAAASTAAASPAAPYVWHDVAIGGGGFIPGIVFSRAERGLVYLRTDIGGAYRWDLGQQRWLPLQDSMSESQYFGIESLAADPVDANVVYMAAGMYGRESAHAVLRSSDRGASWQVFPVSFRMGGNEPGRGVGERLAIDGRDRKVLYFGSRHDGLQRSADAGEHWQRVESFPMPGGGRTGVSFVIAEASPILIAGVADAGPHHLFRSDDAGTTWRAVAGEPAAALLPVQAKLAATGALYISYSNGAGPDGVTDGAVFRYELGSGAWTDVTPDREAAHPQRGFMGLGLDAQHPATLVVASLNSKGAGDTLWRSLDAGLHWQSLRERSRMDVSATPFLKWSKPEADFGWWMAGVAIDPFDSTHVVFSTGATLYDTHEMDAADAGKPITWRPWVTGMEETAILALASPPLGPALLSGFGDIGGFAHVDLTRSPPSMYVNPAWDNTFGVDFAALMPRVVVRSGRRHDDPLPDTRTLAYSEDSGGSWQPLQLPDAARSPRYLRGEVPIIVTADGSGFVAMTPVPLLTRDRGASWSAVHGLPQGLHIIADRADAQALYALDFTAGEIYASTDGGSSFIAVGTRGLQGQIGDGTRIRVDAAWPLQATPGSKGDLWFTDQGALWHSLNGGRSFARVANAQRLEIGVLSFGKAAPGHTYPALYAIGSADGVRAIWRSDDSGANWQRLNDAQHEYGRRFRALSGDPRVYGRVYVGTDGRGIVYGDVASGSAAARAPQRLIFTAPAADWEREGLPIGNGALGAMITGGIEHEQLQFNEKTLWTGGPGSKAGYDFGLPQQSMAAQVASVVADLDRTPRLEPEAVAARIGRKAHGFGEYQDFGALELQFDAHSAAVTQYRRELDIDSAVASVSYEQGGVHYRREYFASFADHVIVLRLSADRPGQIDVGVGFSAPAKRSVERTAGGDTLRLRGTLDDNALRFEAQARVLATGGTRTATAEGVVQVKGADGVIIVLGAGTAYRLHYPDYRGRDPHAQLQQRLDRARALGFAALLARHEADYRPLFERVHLELGEAAPGSATGSAAGSTAALTLEQLLNGYGQGDAQLDRALEALYFQYGRYLLLASSRAGSLPANLQGVWNNSIMPPWNDDYHVNINLQMNYWLAESTNLPETTAPLFEFVDSWLPPGRLAARTVYGAQGWMLSLNTNPWGYTGLIDWPTSFWQPEAAAWMAEHYYEHYRFSGDERFLRERAWPVMKQAALFWLDALHVDPRDGKLVVSPSYSPEHGPFSAGAAMSQQIVADLFSSVAEAAQLVGDRALYARVLAAQQQLDPGLRVGSWGQLQEWKLDWDDAHDEHRHVSQLYALHPGHQVSLARTPLLAAAARRTLDARGDGGTGWSKAWKINFWARLEDGDRALRLLGEQLRNSTLPNLLDTHPPFQIDGNFGATAGVAEMLLQSQQGELALLPALPAAWPCGSVRGLRARGGLTVDLEWSEHRLQRAVLHASRDAPVVLRSGLLRDPAARLIDVDSGRLLALTGAGEEREFRAERGHNYALAAR